MKIDPKRDYKKPLYAIGAAALIGMTMLGTSCGPQIAGEMTAAESSVEIDGGLAVCEDTDN